MKRAREDNTVGIIQRAVKHYGLHVVKGTVKEALKSHPDYPSLRVSAIPSMNGKLKTILSGTK